jgi:transposase
MSHPRVLCLVTEAAAVVGFCERWARIIVRRYNAEGPEGIGDKRRANTGQVPCLRAEQKDDLRRALLHESPPDGGLWTSVKVADWIGKTTGTRPSDVTGWHYLYEAGFTLKVPRPRHERAATPEETATFKKTLNSASGRSGMRIRTKQ